MKEKKIFKRLAYLFIIIGGVLLLWLFLSLYYFGYLKFSDEISIQYIGNIGSFIGGVGVFFTLASVLLLYDTLSLQRKSLEENRKSFNVQNLENVFFNLTERNHSLRKDIVYVDKSKDRIVVYKGYELFDLIKEEYKSIYSSLKSGKCIDDSLIDKFTGIDKAIKEIKRNHLSEEKIIKESYRFIFTHYHNHIGHYFRNLYQVLTFLSIRKHDYCIVEEPDTSITVEGVPSNYYSISVSIDNYAEYIQAQMSSSELFLLFYNTLCFDKMKMRIEEFELLENLCVEDLLDESHQQFYNFKLKKRADIFK